MTEALSLADELSELFREDVSVAAIRQREFGGAKISVVTMSYRATSHSSSSGKYHEHTAVVLDDDQLHVPEFSLSPSVGGLLGKMLKAFGNFAAVEFPDSPEFSQRYLVHGWAVEPVRVLFTKAIRDYFTDHPGWCVRGKKNRLVLYQPDHVCDQAAVDEFIRQSLEILGLFQEGEEKLDAHPEIRRDARPEDISAAASRIGGIAGAMIQKQLRKIAVTRHELDSFAAAAPPRDIPCGMRRQVIGNNLPLVFIGILFFFGGIVGGTVWMILTEGWFKLLSLPFFLFLTGGGLVMTFLTLRHRRRKVRTLRDGILTPGIITDVTTTGVTVNDQRRFHVEVQFDDEGQQRKTTCNAYGPAVDQARTLKDSGEETSLLVDPEDAAHVVCLDLLLLFD